MTGKIRVSIVATALDGYKTDNKTVLNMVSRIQNRNTGYSENLFSHSPRVENNTISSIDGATALKLDESYQLDEDHKDNLNSIDNNLANENLNVNSVDNQEKSSNVISGVSIESASYIENNNLDSNDEILSSTEDNEEEYTQDYFLKNKVIKKKRL